MGSLRSTLFGPKGNSFSSDLRSPYVQESYSSSSFTAGRSRWPFSRSRKHAEKVAQEIIEAQQQEIDGLQARAKKQEGAVASLEHLLAERDLEAVELQERWNFQEFKYELLVDMWALRVLDNEELGQEAGS